MEDDFTVEDNTENEDKEILEELEGEQVLSDLQQMMDLTPQKNYCVTCFYNPENDGKCPVLKMMDSYVKTHNGIYKISPKIERVENRWGCTSHKQVEAIEPQSIETL